MSGSLQARTTRRASYSLSSSRWHFLFGARRLRAASRPSSKYCFASCRRSANLFQSPPRPSRLPPVRPLKAMIGFDQDSCMSELVGGDGAGGDQTLELFTFNFSWVNEILFFRLKEHNGPRLSMQITRHRPVGYSCYLASITVSNV